MTDTEQQIIDHTLSILKSCLYQPDFYFTKPEDSFTYLKLAIAQLQYESFQILFLDSKHGLINLTEMFRGTIDQAAVYPREVVKAALHFNAAAIICAHNHPSGSIDPSSADKNITQTLVSALDLIGVNLLDHIIVGGNKTFSFAEHGLI